MNYLILISTLISAIKSIEQLMPTSPGKEKAEAVITLIEGIIGSVSPLLPAIQSLITMIVTGLNASGVFSKKAA